MRVLPSLAAPPPPVGEPTWRSERPARMAKQQRRPEWRQGRPPGRPEGTRGASTEAPLTQAEDGVFLGGAGERSQRLGLSRSLRSDGPLTWSRSRTEGKARQPEGDRSEGRGGARDPALRVE